MGVSGSKYFFVVLLVFCVAIVVLRDRFHLPENMTPLECCL